MYGDTIDINIVFVLRVQGTDMIHARLLWNDHHCESCLHPSPYVLTHFFLVMRTFKICSLNVWMYNTVLLTRVTILYIVSPGLIYLVTASRSLWPPSPILPAAHALPVVTTNLFSVSRNLIVLDSTCKWEHTVFVFLGLTYFTERNALKVHPCCCRWICLHILFIRCESLSLVYTWGREAEHAHSGREDCQGIRGHFKVTASISPYYWIHTKCQAPR